MSDSPSLGSPIPIIPSLTPSQSPRRNAGPSSPLLPRTGLLPAIPSVRRSSGEFESGSPSPPPLTSSRTSVVMGFSPAATHQVLSAVPESSSTSPRSAPLGLNTTATRRMNTRSPPLSTPIDQVFQLAEGSPRPQPSSPRTGGLSNDYLPRSRRNSAAIVSISLSSRSRSGTPQGSSTTVPGQISGNNTPNKASGAPTPKGNEQPLQMSESWAPGVDELDDWQPAGGMLLDHGEDEVSAVDDYMDDYDDKVEQVWSGFSDSSPVVEDVLTPGMVIGEGLKFQGEIIVPAVSRMAMADGSDVGLPLRRGGSEATKVLRQDGRYEKKRYEVVRRLGTGSYAVVYLVKERGGKKEYALKCLSKQDLKEEQLETQLFEAHIHLSLPIHQNIVTLHQTLQTRRWLFLMLELCPGEDLFYWLEKSRDASPQAVHASLPDEHAALSSSKLSSSSIPFSSSQMFSNLNSMSFSQSPGAAFSQSHSHFGGSPASLLFAHHNGGHYSSHFMPSQTPPTPSLLSAFSANTLLSQRRLRLIASMFSQMCEAVAVCHDAGVSHRDIKPENFICCDSVELEAAADGEFGEDEGQSTKPVNFGPQAKRKVIVKLTDFGLATTDYESGDVECGSKPYMSYECRNNLGPSYLPAPADVWSLGIVLINMLFHRNPWKDPTHGDPNFDNFLMDPIGFILSKFTGIGREVASYLADHVLCIDVDQRVSAREFGAWIKGLPEMIGGRKAMHSLKLSRLDTHKAASVDKGMFMKSPMGNSDAGKKFSTSALTSAMSSSTAGLGSTPTLSGLPPPSSLLEEDEVDLEHESPVGEQVEVVEPEPILPTPPLESDGMYSAATSATVDEQTTPTDESAFPSPSAAPSSGIPEEQDDSRDCVDSDTRSLSTHKRRKRGVRKGKAAQAAAAAAAATDDPLSQSSRDALLSELASASQSLAREMSKLHKPSVDVNRIEDFPPLGVTAAQVAAEKKSKWKDMMKLSQGNPELAALAKRVKERDSDSSLNLSAPAQLQGGKPGGFGAETSKGRHAYPYATMSSDSSAVSNFGQITSATSTGTEDEFRGRGAAHRPRKEGGNDSRSRKAAQAAAAIAGVMEPMGSFGRPSHIKPVPHHAHTTGSIDYDILSSASDGNSFYTQQARPSPKKDNQAIPSAFQKSVIKPALSSVDSATTIRTATVASESASSSGTVTIAPTSPNKPKLKGQISTLAKMLSGLKTKGKD
ncbi:serine/threonine protein kinase [Cryptococcus neoformans Bt85]|nr:serine/threonine protein kinase [Cryptococcus neoformans var. grubii Bt85]